MASVAGGRVVIQNGLLEARSQVALAAFDLHGRHARATPAQPAQIRDYNVAQPIDR
jgi:hypothetical protein